MSKQILEEIKRCAESGEEQDKDAMEAMFSALALDILTCFGREEDVARKWLPSEKKQMKELQAAAQDLFETMQTEWNKFSLKERRLNLATIHAAKAYKGVVYALEALFNLDTEIQENIDGVKDEHLTDHIDSQNKNGEDCIAFLKYHEDCIEFLKYHLGEKGLKEFEEWKANRSR